MLDRKTIKKDVKGILGGESKGSVFLATLIVFIMGAVYFGCVWLVGQFFPVTQTDILAAAQALETPVTISQADLDAGNYQAVAAQLIAMLTPMGNIVGNVGKIFLLSWLLEIIIALPLRIGVQKFMLRVIRLKNPGAGTVLRGYTGSYFFRSIMLPLWQWICIQGWRIILSILFMGIVAGIFLYAGQSIAPLSELMTLTQDELLARIAAIDPAQIQQVGVIAIAAVSGWCLLSFWLLLFKEISYSLSGMALAERPQIGVRKAVRASRRIARRHHFALFVVSLSFIGWYILAGIAIALVAAVGIGLNMLNLGQLGLIITLGLLVVVVLLVMYLLIPYRVGVHARCYVTLKRIALEDGIVIKDDFRGKRELRASEE